MKPMQYRDYAARIEYSDEDHCFVGHIAGIRDIVGFHGDSVAELEAAFHGSVDHYIDVSNDLGVEPQKPYSGKVVLRMPPELHAKAAIRAESAGKSFNQLANEALRELVER
jgi:predicted HicB family RNase H-like nuclease